MLKKIDPAFIKSNVTAAGVDVVMLTKVCLPRVLAVPCYHKRRPCIFVLPYSRGPLGLQLGHVSLTLLLTGLHHKPLLVACVLCVLQDTVAILWLNNTAQTQQAVQALQAKADSLGTQELLYGDLLVSLTSPGRLYGRTEVQYYLHCAG
jgi:hypothetical protein